MEQNKTGYLLIVLAVFFYSIQGLCIKLLPPNFRVWDIIFYRLGGGLLLLFILSPLFSQRISSPTKDITLFFRGITGTVAFSSLVLSIRHLPFSTAIFLFYSFPIFSALFSYLLFQEKIDKHGLICLFVILIGVFFIFGFSFEGNSFWKLIALNSALFAGLTISLIRKLRNFNTVTVYFSFCLIGTFLCLYPFMLSYQLPVNIIEFSFLFLISTLSLIGQLLLAVASYS